jgi:hypothetical protein
MPFVIIDTFIHEKILNISFEWNSIFVALVHQPRIVEITLYLSELFLLILHII